MKRFIKSKKGLAVVATLAVLGAAIGAYAYFTAGGSGTGTAQTGHAQELVIRQLGAGYDSLIPNSDSSGYPGPYIQDQCMNSCSGITEIGNEVTLATPGTQRLADVVVALRNRGPAIAQGALTITVDVNGHIATAAPAIAGVQSNGRPTVTEVTVDFSGTAVFVPQTFTYGISFPELTGISDALNVALSSSLNDISAGTDGVPGSLFVKTDGTDLSSDGDFPSCVGTGSTTFAAFATTCGDPAPANPGAYGTHDEVLAGNADIPAVEINVVGGTVGPLSPDGPAQPVGFAVTNPGPTSANLSSVTVPSFVLNGPLQSDTGQEACAAGMYSTSGSATFAAPGTQVNPGQTLFILPSATNTTKVSMHDDGNNQNNCQNLTLTLTFASS
jgi:hypothetical protein